MAFAVRAGPCTGIATDRIGQAAPSGAGHDATISPRAATRSIRRSSARQPLELGVQLSELGTLGRSQIPLPVCVAGSKDAPATAATGPQGGLEDPSSVFPLGQGLARSSVRLSARPGPGRYRTDVRVDLQVATPISVKAAPMFAGSSWRSWRNKIAKSATS